MKTVSVIVITKNEEGNIAACLDSVQWAHDIVVVDAGSTDKTVAIAKKKTRKVYVRPWEGFGAARNFGLKKCSGEWVLWIDADERVTPELAREIQNAVSSGDNAVAGYSVPRKAFFLGKWIRHCGWYPGRVVRLFRKTSGTFTDHRVHERLVLSGEEGVLLSDLIHLTDPNLFHYFEKFNRYTSLGADEFVRSGQRPGFSHIILRPLWTFIRMYVLRAGFLDGVHGFLLCANSAFYVFVKYSKAWEHSLNSSNGADAL